MSHGTLYGIGVGPGDPELLTIKAVNTLKKSRCVFAPRPAPGTTSTALAIARPYIPKEAVVKEIAFPMVRDRTVLTRRWAAAAAEVVSVLAAGADACFLTLGDPLLYSTYIYLVRAVRDRLRTASVETVPGITAFCAAAALTGFPIGEAKTPARIIPTADDLNEVRCALQGSGTTVLMKIGDRLGAILDLLETSGLLAHAVLVSKAGLPGERIVTDLRTARGMGEAAGYLSVILVNPDWSPLP